MTEEEKKAIDLLKFYEGFFKNIGHEEEVKSIESVINCIEKLQKEIEEKTTIILVGAEKVKSLEKENEELLKQDEKYVKHYVTMRDIKKYFIHKDKIRNFIEKHKDNFYDGTANGCDYIDYEVIKEFIEEE